jgi:predicted RNA-binding Zn-ribbon protein involved in translation (DUF1610 family)
MSGLTQRESRAQANQKENDKKSHQPCPECGKESCDWRHKVYSREALKEIIRVQTLQKPEIEAYIIAKQKTNEFYCPRCGLGLVDTYPGVACATDPVSKDVHCPRGCSFTARVRC